MILTLGMVYHLPLRQTEGFARSLLSLMGLPLRVPRHSTLSRRRKTLDIQPLMPSAQGPTDIVLDGSGLKIFGTGERYLAGCPAPQHWPWWRQPASERRCQVDDAGVTRKWPGQACGQP
jgi:hypothetical protein